MRRILIALGFGLALLAWHTEVHAACTTHTYFIGGRMVVCTTCCYGTNCNTTCF